MEREPSIEPYFFSRRTAIDLINFLKTRYGVKIGEISERTGVSRITIWRITSGRNFQHSLLEKIFREIKRAYPTEYREFLRELLEKLITLPDR